MTTMKKYLIPATEALEVLSPMALCAPSMPEDNGEDPNAEPLID